MSTIIYPEQSYQIMGACFEVYKGKGCGFLEAVYQECLELEFADRGMPFAAQQKLNLTYKGRPLKQTYEPDFVCDGKITPMKMNLSKQSVASDHSDCEMFGLGLFSCIWCISW